MKEFIKTKRFKVISSLAILALFVIIGSLTYAYFRASLESNTSATVVIETADYGELYVSYAEGKGEISEDNIQ